MIRAGLVAASLLLAGAALAETDPSLLAAVGRPPILKRPPASLDAAQGARNRVRAL